LPKTKRVFTIYVYWMQITISRAEALMEINTRNRAVKMRQVNKYSGDMVSETWFYNGSTICVSAGPDHVLLDGQNRLLAVIKSGKPIWSLVLIGLPLASQDEMDNGCARSFKDTLAIAGEKNSSKLASLVRADLEWQNGVTQKGLHQTAYSRSQLQKHLDSHPELRDVLFMSVTAQRKYDICQSAANQCTLLFWRIDPEDCQLFWKKLATNGGLDEGNPILALQNALLSAQQEKRRGRPMHNRNKMALIIKTWNAYRTGHQIKHLMFRGGGAKPHEFPTPI
jgi:hypothetical protein